MNNARCQLAEKEHDGSSKVLSVPETTVVCRGSNNIRLESVISDQITVRFDLQVYVCGFLISLQQKYKL